MCVFTGRYWMHSKHEIWLRQEIGKCICKRCNNQVIVIHYIQAPTLDSAEAYHAVSDHEILKAKRAGNARLMVG